MINIDLKPMLKGGISRYSLCVAVAKRAREINDAAYERSTFLKKSLSVSQWKISLKADARSRRAKRSRNTEVKSGAAGSDR